MALLNTGPMSWGAIRTEYGKTGAFSLGDCAGLNGALPASATATVSALSFRSALYGPDDYTMTRALDPVFFVSYGYAQGVMGSINNRAVKEVATQWQEIFTNTNNSTSYIKITNYAQVWQLWHGFTNVWAQSKFFNGTDQRYEWASTVWFNTTGSTAIQIRYNG